LGLSYKLKPSTVQVSWIMGIDFNEVPLSIIVSEQEGYLLS